MDCPLPYVLPVGWKVEERRLDGAMYRHGSARMTVIVSASVERDGRNWLHVSVAHPERMPTWDDLRYVKDIFVGRDRTALQVLPPAAKHVNQHPYCLHLWACLDGDVTPDFTQGGETI